MITASTALTDEGTATLTIGEQAEQITGKNLTDLRSVVLKRVTVHAQSTAAPVQLDTRDPDGSRWILLVHPDGNIEDRTTQQLAAEETEAPALSPEGEDSAPSDEVEDTTPPKRRSIRDRLAQPSTPTSSDNQARTTATVPPKTVQAPTEVARPTSFLTPNVEEEPAREGWRGRLNTMGLHLAPAPDELDRRQATAAVSSHFAGPRTIIALNGKGGSGKSPAVAYLSAAFARLGGGGVLAVDCNLTRGTLGWSTEQANHEATMLDLLPRTEDLLGAGAQVAALGSYVHHQTRDRYDVLRSNPLLLSTEQKLTPQDFDKLHAVAAKYYRMIFLDSGNDEGDALWLQLVTRSHQIVVPTNP